MSRTLMVVLFALMLAGCARGAKAPPPAPSLEGQRIMLLPVRATDPPALNAELAFWLGQQAPSVDWLFPDDLQQVVDRQPGWRVRLDALPRGIGDAGTRSPYLPDPTYTELRRLGAVADVTLAIMPVSTRRAEGPQGPTLELTVAILDVRVGQVLWVGTVQGPVADGAGRDGTAAVAEALARALFPT